MGYNTMARTRLNFFTITGSKDKPRDLSKKGRDVNMLDTKLTHSSNLLFLKCFFKEKYVIYYNFMHVYYLCHFK